VHNRPFVNLVLARNVEERFDHPLITQNRVPRVSRTPAKSPSRNAESFALRSSSSARSFIELHFDARRLALLGSARLIIGISPHISLRGNNPRQLVSGFDGPTGTATVGSGEGGVAVGLARSSSRNLISG
jgi:hypothetical protein